jgi:hypothetical protein
MRAEARAFLRFATTLPRWLRATRTHRECLDGLAGRMAARESSFLRTVEHCVLAEPESPFARLLGHAGVELGDIESMVRDEGLEGALGRLNHEGVRLTLEEMKGLTPIRRGSLELHARPEDFDNSITPRSLEVRGGGSRSAGTRVNVDLDAMAGDADYYWLFREGFGLAGRPVALWYPAPPGIAGIKTALINLKLGAPAERWFSQTPVRWRSPYTRSAVFTIYGVAASRAVGRPLARPEHTPPAQAERVVRWLADKRAAGPAPVLQCTPSSAVRVCQAAARLGLDISGTFFRCGGEPYTEGKAAVVEGAGCSAGANYYMTELGGPLGIACARPGERGDVHVLTDRVAVIQRDRELEGGESVGALLFTNLLPTSPKLAINLETDDYGVLEQRECGCAVGQVGHDLHLHTIRNYDKLTSEGMSFVGSELIVLLEEVLPSRFGGGAGDYQLVEEESGGLPRVRLVVSPAVGEVDEAAVAAAAFEHLSAQGRGQRMMAGVWRDSGTLEVVRREPHVTRSSKITPLHVEREPSASP